jgi:HAD superfamily hydrolase (TIGR01549 family)
VTLPTETDARAPLRAVFLDTVMRPNPSWEHVYALVFEEFGVTVDVEQLYAALRQAYRHGGWGHDSGFEPTEETSFRRTVAIDAAAIEALGLAPMPDAFYRRLAEMFMLTSHWHVFPDVLPALDELKARGLTIGAVSNWVWNLPELLHSLEIVSYFDFIAASARIGFEKPHPQIFRWALEQAGTSAETVIHVGDHIGADVEGARGVGIAPVLIDRSGRVPPSEVPDGVPVISSLEELVPIVDVRIGDARAA